MKADVLNRMMKVNEPDGYLFLGAAETVVGLTDAFKPVPDRRSLYAPNLALRRVKALAKLAVAQA
jgi:chemotaxis protein methyltransferase CheR